MATRNEERETREENGRLALIHYREISGIPYVTPGAAAADLLLDLAHYCLANDIDLAAALRSLKARMLADSGVPAGDSVEGRDAPPCASCERDAPGFRCTWPQCSCWDVHLAMKGAGLL